MVEKAVIRAITYHLPERVLTNDQLAGEFVGWTPDKIEAKTGIRERHIAAETECSSDLAVAAAGKLFASGACQPQDIDYLILCTQTPDHLLPTTACLVQDRIGLPTTAGAIDINQGCSGFVYGLSVAKGLIETEQAGRVLLITAETYTRLIHPEDRSVRTIFGDAAAATLVEAADGAGLDSSSRIGPFVFGTNGKGAGNLIVPNGGMRQHRLVGDAEAQRDENGNVRGPDNLYMNGAEIFNFTLRVVPQCLSDLLARAAMRIEDVDLFVFHQANQYMLDHLRKKLRIPEEKFIVSLRDCGNTVSSTIPIALKRAWEQGRLKAGQRIVLLGFGVGYSWAGTVLRWDADASTP